MTSRYALALLFFVVVVSSCRQDRVTSPATNPPDAVLKHDAACALACGGPQEVFGDEWCAGGIWRWSIRCVFYTTPCTAPVTVKVLAITTAGDVVPFGVDRHLDESTSDCGTRRTFEVQGIAPRAPIGDDDRGFPKFLVEVYSGDHSEPVSTFEIYSDIQLSPNDELHRPLCKAD